MDTHTLSTASPGTTVMTVIVKGTLSFYKFDTDSVIERQKIRIPLSEGQSFYDFRRYAGNFLAITDQAIKFGLGSSFDLRMYKFAPNAKNTDR